jgi:hypothetical protein
MVFIREGSFEKDRKLKSTRKLKSSFLLFRILTLKDPRIKGWTTLELLYAQDRFNLTIPEELLNNLNAGIDIILVDDDVNDPLYGGAGYTSSSTNENSYNNWINIHKVGHLLAMMSLVGDPISSPRVQAALSFIERHFNTPNSGANGANVGASPDDNGYFDVGWRG